MERETGSGVRVEVRGGRYDGALGTIINVEYAEDCKLTHVRLDLGATVVIRSDIEQADQEIPREHGTEL